MKPVPLGVGLRIATACLATIVLWWFVLPDMPEKAIVEGLVSSGVATYAMARLVAWGLL